MNDCEYASFDKTDICVPCVICGADVKLTDNERFGLIAGVMQYKTCQRCKDAVAWAAKEMPLICGREYNKN